MAKLHFKYGAMNSGKSDVLIKTAFNYRENGHPIATIKPEIDTKGGRMIVARAGAELEADILAKQEDDLRLEVSQLIARKDLETLAVVLIDEAQFLQPEQIDQLYNVAKLDDISVIAYGLRTDFQTRTFPGSKRLFELADNIEKLPTMCRCDSQAEFNCRIVDGQFVFEGDQVAIDGDQEVSYQSLCGKCLRTEQAAIS